MSRHLKIAAAQLGPIHLADTRASVVERLVALMRKAHAQGARFIVFPELALTTFFPRWWMEDQTEVDRRFFEREMSSPATQPLFEEGRRLNVGYYIGYDHATADLQRPAVARQSVGSAHCIVHPQPPLDGDDVRGPIEGRRFRFPRTAYPTNGLEKLLEPGRCHDPDHDEIFRAFVDDLVLDVIAEEAGGARHEAVCCAVDQDTASATKADLQFDLPAVRVLANASARCDALKAHGQTVESGIARNQRGIGVTISRHGLPIGWTFARLDDDGASADRLGLAHGYRS
jgi:hypothetical protein